MSFQFSVSQVTTLRENEIVGFEFCGDKYCMSFRDLGLRQKQIQVTGKIDGFTHPNSC